MVGGGSSLWNGIRFPPVCYGSAFSPATVFLPLWNLQAHQGLFSFHCHEMSEKAPRTASQNGAAHRSALLPHALSCRSGNQRPRPSTSCPDHRDSEVGILDLCQPGLRLCFLSTSQRKSLSAVSEPPELNSAESRHTLALIMSDHASVLTKALALLHASQTHPRAQSWASGKGWVSALFTPSTRPPGTAAQLPTHQDSVLGQDTRAEPRGRSGPYFLETLFCVQD